jgi:CDP-paratose 2-epimerase
MKVVVTGGSGFIGSNLAAHYLAGGHQVTVFDSLVREGTRRNLAWLASLSGDLNIVTADVRDFQSVRKAIGGADAVYHLAAQVAVTTSVDDPRTDFEVNALGTFNVLEAVRRDTPSAFLGYSSTNKVYGGLDDLVVRPNGSRYVFDDLLSGIPETRPIDFHSPYGCSKGAGDQYVRDYSRIYGIRTVVFRQACIYGPHQFGNEDQGWVAHFVNQALRGQKITIYGDGLQVRDVLHVDDLISCYEAARQGADRVAGEIFNLGGGPGNTISLLELIDYLEQTLKRPVTREFAPWRPGDQKIYVSDISKAADKLGWEPSIGVRAGLDRLVSWLADNIASLPTPVK